MTRRIKLWAPGIFDEKGGIQVFTNFLLEALRRSNPDTLIEVHLLDDKDSDQTRPGVKFHYYGGFRSRALRKLFFAAGVFTSEIRCRSDLIISTHVNFGPLARVVSTVFCGIKYWLVAHGVDAWKLSPLRLWGAKGADKVLSVSKFTSSKMRGLSGGEKINSFDFPNTFDEKSYAPQDKNVDLLSKFGVPTDSKVILTVGRLSSAEKYKGHDLIIEALKEVKKYIPNVHYLVVGTGDDEQRLRNAAFRCDVSERVHFCGFIPDKMLSDIYNLCDVFAMPSRGEGFGIVYLEALASGKPCIASSLDGGQDALLGGELGTLVDIEKEDALAKALVDSLREISPAKAAIKREKVIEHFGFEAFCKRLNSALDNTLGGAK